MSGDLQQEIADVFHGSVTAACWLDFEEKKNDGFAYGCVNGTIHVYRFSPKRVSCYTSLPGIILMIPQGQYVFVSITDAHNGRTVEDIRFNGRFRRIATIGDGSPCVWRMESTGSLSLSKKYADRSQGCRNVKTADERCLPSPVLAAQHPFL